MFDTFSGSSPARAPRVPATRPHAWAWRGLVAGALALGTLPAFAEEAAPPHAATIRRSMFSADSFAGIETQFAEMKVVFDAPLVAPAERGTTRAVGTGPSGFTTPFAIDRVDGRFHAYAERGRPQHPVGALPYRAHDVVFDSTEPGVSPVGTLTFPASGGPFPAIVLLAGSGAHTRDAGMSLHRTLAVLADHLTRQGFAVLRYDKRGVGLTGGAAHPDSTTDQYAADALAAVRYLRAQPNVDPGRVGVVGHSEGAIIAAMVAADAPDDVAFVVMLAGTGMPGLDLKSGQDAATRRAQGMPESLVQLNRSQERELLEIAAGDLDRTQAIAAMAAATDALPADTKATLGIPAEGLPVEAYEGLLSPWLRRFLQIDPRTYLERVRCPVLALVGSKDLQVPPAENLAGIREALARDADPRDVVRELPGINHNLQTARTGLPHEYFLIEETVAPAVLAPMSAWLADVVHPPADD